MLEGVLAARLRRDRRGGVGLRRWCEKANRACLETKSCLARDVFEALCHVMTVTQVTDLGQERAFDDPCSRTCLEDLSQTRVIKTCDGGKVRTGRNQDGAAAQNITADLF